MPRNRDDVFGILQDSLRHRDQGQGSAFAVEQVWLKYFLFL